MSDALEIVIDELVLPGCVTDPRALALAVAARLGELLAETPARDVPLTDVAAELAQAFAGAIEGPAR